VTSIGRQVLLINDLEINDDEQKSD